ARKEERVAASKIIPTPKKHQHAPVRVEFHPAASAGGSKDEHGYRDWIACVRDALYCSKICSYAQGFALMTAASKTNDWGLKLGEIAKIFRGGCIIRARFLQKITEAYQRQGNLANLLLDPYFAGVMETANANWRAVVARAAVDGIPVPAFSSALAYF